MARSGSPYRFLKIGSRWINIALVTDVRDYGDKLSVHVAAPALMKAETMATGGRRIVITEPGEVAELRKWLQLHDENTG